MKHKEIRSIAGEDNPDMRAVQEQVRRFAEGLGCRYTWAPGAVGGENIDLAGAGALIVDGDEMNVRLADCSEAGAVWPFFAGAGRSQAASASGVSTSGSS